MERHLSLADHVAHCLGFLAGSDALRHHNRHSIKPRHRVDHPILINKMFLSSSAFGLACVLLTRRQHGQDVWKRPRGRRWQAGRMAAVGLVLASPWAAPLAEASPF